VHKLVHFTLFLTHGRNLIHFTFFSRTSVYRKLIWAKSYFYSSLIFNGHILSLVHFCCTFLQLCCPSEKIGGGNSLLLGLMKSQEAKIGMQISPTIADSEKYFDVILSLDFLKLQSNKLQFDAIPRAHSFIEKVDKEWVTVTTSTPNSFELSCSIYSSLNACSLDKVCIVEVRG